MPRFEQKHSLATRLFHWINVPILAIMIYSGLLIYWANDVYAIRLGGITIVKFFPDWFYWALHLDHRLAEGMAWHFTFMWFFAINGLLYVAYTTWSGEWRYLLPNRHTFAEAWQVVRHDLGLRKEPLPRRKFNGAQRLAYTGVVAMGAGSVLTLGYVAFFVIHITQLVRAGWNNFRAMVIGVEVAGDEEISYEYAGQPDGAPREYAGRRTASTRSSAGRRAASTRE